MPGRMSNRDRIAHARLEADATSKAKQQSAEKAEKSPAPRKRSAAKAQPAAAGRIRIVWAVCGPNGKTVETFAYAKEAEARARATALTEESGKTHFVKKDEEPFE